MASRADKRAGIHISGPFSVTVPLHITSGLLRVSQGARGEEDIPPPAEEVGERRRSDMTVLSGWRLAQHEWKTHNTLQSIQVCVPERCNPGVCYREICNPGVCYRGRCNPAVCVTEEMQSSCVLQKRCNPGVCNREMQGCFSPLESLVGVFTSPCFLRAVSWTLLVPLRPFLNHSSTQNMELITASLH